MPLHFNFKFGKNVKKQILKKTTPQLLSNKLLKNAFTLFTCKNADTIWLTELKLVMPWVESCAEKRSGS